MRFKTAMTQPALATCVIVTSTLIFLALGFLADVKIGANIESLSQWTAENRSLSDVLLASTVFMICAASFFIGSATAGANIIYFSVKNPESKFGSVFLQFFFILSMSACLRLKDEAKCFGDWVWIGSLLCGCYGIIHSYLYRDGVPANDFNSPSSTMLSILAVVSICAILSACVELHANIPYSSPMNSITAVCAAFIASKPLFLSNYTIFSRATNSSGLGFVQGVASTFSTVLMLCQVFQSTLCDLDLNAFCGSSVVSGKGMFFISVGPAITVLYIISLGFNSISSSDDPDKDPVDPDADPDDPDADGGEPDDRGKFGGGLIILAVNILTSLFSLVFVVVIVLEIVQQVLLNVICYNCGKGCIYKDWCWRLNGSLSLETVLVLACGLTFANFVGNDSTKGASNSLGQTEGMVSLLLAILGAVWKIVGPEGNFALAMAVLFLTFACVACGKLLSMYQKCIVAEDGEVNDARVLLAPVNVFLAIVSSVIYLTLGLFEHTTSKFLYSTVVMLALGAFLFTFQNLIFSSVSKKSISFIVSPMLASFLIPMHISIFLSSVSGGFNVNLTEEHEHIADWIRKNSILFCFTFLAIYTLTSVFLSVGSFLCRSCASLLTTSKQITSASHHYIESDQTELMKSEVLSSSVLLVPQKYVDAGITFECFMMNLLNVSLNVILALTFGILFETQVNISSSITMSNGGNTMLAVVGVFALTAAGTSFKTFILALGSGYLLSDTYGPCAVLVTAICSFVGSAGGACVLSSAQYTPGRLSSALTSRGILLPEIIFYSAIGVELRSSQSAQTLICLASFIVGASTLFTLNKKQASQVDTYNSTHGDICVPLLIAQNV